MNAGITAIVLTLNEAEHLPDCLESLVPLTSDVIVFDSGSTDGTLDVARQAGARIEYRPFDGYANQRNAALALPRLASWVLFIDADERLSQAGALEMRNAVLRANKRIAVFAAPRRNIFFGRVLKGGGWWPDTQWRLMRVGRAFYDPRHQVHERLRARGAREHLEEPLEHLNYATWSEFRAKQRSYSRTLADDRSRLGVIPARKEYVSAPLREIKRRFVTHHGYRDGLLGLCLALVMGWEAARVRWYIRHTKICPA